MKFLVDMNLSPRWISFLTEAGFEAVHWSDVGSIVATDTEIMAHAESAGFVVLTHDLDFGAILAAGGRTGPSVVQVRADDVRPQAIGRVVLTALRQVERDLARGALVTIDPRRTRIRVLPLVRP